MDVEGGVRSLLLTAAAECLSVSVCADHKRACLYRYGEGPRATTSWTEERRRGLSTTLEFPCFSLLETEPTGVFLFAGGKVHLFHQFNDVNKMKAAAEMIKIV